MLKLVSICQIPIENWEMKHIGMHDPIKEIVWGMHDQLMRQDPCGSHFLKKALIMIFELIKL